MQQLTQIIANEGWEPFEESTLSLIASAFAAMNDIEPHEGLDIEAFTFATLGACNLHRSNVPLCLAIAQKQWREGYQP
jgi:hypothetical protein